MKYTILVYEVESEISARTDAKRKDAYWGADRAARRAGKRSATPPSS